MRRLLFTAGWFGMLSMGAGAVLAPVVTAMDAAATQLPGPSAVLFNAPYYACGRNYYVSLTGSDANSGTAINTPWLTLQHANDSGRSAGDCVNVAPGTYAHGVLINSGGNLASKTGYVVYRCESMDACIVNDVSAGGQNGSFVWNTSPRPMTGSYVIIDGFKLAAASQTTFGQGVELWDGNEGAGAANSVHHVWILNSVISGYGQSGVQMNDGEYFYVVHNTIYNNSRTACSAQGSGISFAGLKAFAGYVRTSDDGDNKMLGSIGTFNNAIEYNVVFNNAITQCGTQQSMYDTDGNNIIADTLNNAGSGVVYPGTLLIAFNVTYNGGGRGIDLFRSENVTVANNSCYNSSLDPYDAGTYRPCIGDNIGYNNTFVNNIAWAITAAPPLNFNTAYAGAPTSGQQTDTWSNNISYCVGTPPPWGYGCQPMFGGDVFSCTTNKCSVDPMWAQVGATSSGTETSQPVLANFALLAGSPAIGNGLREPYLSSQSTDIGACPNWVKVCPKLRNEPQAQADPTRSHKIGVWGQVPSGVQGQSPWPKR